MTLSQAILTVLLIAGMTLLTRALPFWLFPAGRKTPGYVLYLGRVLPYAVIGMLVVYCLKDMQPLSPPHGLCEIVSVLCVTGLYLWRKNALLAIAGGTAVYMVMIRVM